MPPEDSTVSDPQPEPQPAAPPKPLVRPPVVAIVGRPNVGKSSLLNALVGRRISIVQDEPGVTRDRVSTPVQIDGRWIELVDTGGYGFVDPDKLTEHIRRQVEQAWNKADLVLFIVDAQTGPNAADEEIAALLRKHGGKVALIANKADGEKIDLNLADFARLGLGTPLGVSATTKRNLDALPDPDPTKCRSEVRPDRAAPDGNARRHRRQAECRQEHLRQRRRRNLRGR